MRKKDDCRTKDYVFASAFALFNSDSELISRSDIFQMIIQFIHFKKEFRIIFNMFSNFLINFIIFVFRFVNHQQITDVFVYFFILIIFK